MVQMDMLDSKDPLVVLADTIKWSKFEDEFANITKREDKPILNRITTKTVRKIFSDENVVIAWKRNP